MSQRHHKLYKRKVKLPHVNTLGFNKWIASPGDWLTYKEHHADDSYTVRMARYVGIVHAPAQGPDVPAVKGKLCVIALSDDAHCCYERWIDRADVQSVCSPMPRFLAYFASADPEELIKASEYGSASASHTDWQENPLPCGYPSCPAPHLHRPDGTPDRMKR